MEKLGRRAFLAIAGAAGAAPSLPAAEVPALPEGWRNYVAEYPIVSASGIRGRFSPGVWEVTFRLTGSLPPECCLGACVYMNERFIGRIEKFAIQDGEVTLSGTVRTTQVSLENSPHSQGPDRVG